jgi:ribonuclease E
MTPLQQRVYSELGLSPLLLLDQPPPAGRDTVVRVILPGTAKVDSPVEAKTDTTSANGAPLAEVAQPERLPTESIAKPPATGAPPEVVIDPSHQSPAASRRRRSRSS